MKTKEEAKSFFARSTFSSWIIIKVKDESGNCVFNTWTYLLHVTCFWRCFSLFSPLQNTSSIQTRENLIHLRASISGSHESKRPRRRSEMITDLEDLIVIPFPYLNVSAVSHVNSLASKSFVPRKVAPDSIYGMHQRTHGEGRKRRSGCTKDRATS